MIIVDCRLRFVRGVSVDIQKVARTVITEGAEESATYFLVVRRETHDVGTVVEANSKEEAIDAVEDGEGEELFSEFIDAKVLKDQVEEHF